MTDHNPNRPVGSGLPPEPRVVETRGDGGNSAMALIVGALAVALIIGAFFWFAGDTRDTATLDNPATVGEKTVTTDQPAPKTDGDVIINEGDTNVTAPSDSATDGATDETQQGATDQPQDGEVIDQTQQN